MNKTIQFIALILIALFAIAYFLYSGGQQDIEGLKKLVAPTASLYPEAESFSEKLNFVNDKSESLNLKNWLNQTTVVMRIKRLAHMNTIMLTTQLVFYYLIPT